MNAGELITELKRLATSQRAESSARFFKTAPGQYGYGDKFLGVSVPYQRKIAKKYKNLELTEVKKLIQSPWHEHRLTALFIIVDQYRRGDEKVKKEIFNFYLSHTKYVNNWDLVDSSAPYIVGPWLDNKPQKITILTKLAKSDDLWQKRIAMLSSFYYIQNGRADEAIQTANVLLNDKHDLIQKAVGWMLREVGKRVDKQILTEFLDKNAHKMPRTALRYAIEHFSSEDRTKYLAKKMV